MRVFVSLLLLIAGAAWATAGLQLQGTEKFSVTEQQKLKQWLTQSFTATTEVLGPYPFLTEVYLSRRAATEPVPWAYTQRMRQQQVFFQVDPSFDLPAFQQDWTAAHEFSHLALPLLNKDELWFAEGFASFMQYQVLHHQQQLSQNPAFWYQQKLQLLAPLLLASERPLVTQLKLWLKQHNYKAAYWGGALFFIEADQLLRQQGADLSQLIQRYQQQNRLTDQNLNELIDSLDKLVETPVFAPLLLKYQQQSSQQVWQQHPAYFATIDSRAD